MRAGLLTAVRLFVAVLLAAPFFWVFETAGNADSVALSGTVAASGGCSLGAGGQVNLLQNGFFVPGVPAAQIQGAAWSFAGIPSGSYTLRLSLPGGSNACVGRAEGYAATAPGTGVALTAVLPNVTGHVYPPGGGTAVQGAQVEVLTAAGTFANLAGMQTGSNGGYRLYLPPGQQFVIKASLAPYAPATTAAFTVPADGSPAVVEDVTLQTANVAGTLFAPDGTTPAGNTSIQVVDTNGMYVTNIQVNNAGQFSARLADGTYTLRANPPSGSGYGLGSLTVTVAGDSPGSGQNIVLSTPNVTGHVLTPTGGAISGFANVSVLDSNGHYIQNGPPGASTDNTGAYTLTLPPGTYTLRANAPQGSGYTPGTVAVTITAGGAAQTKDITLTQPNVQGHVTLPNGGGVSTSIMVQTSNGFSSPDVSGTQSGADGSYALRLPPGSWKLVASGTQGFASGSTALTVAADGSVTGSGNIALTSANLAVTVTTPTGSPAPNAFVMVSASGQQGMPLAQGSTDQSGVARFTLAPGTYLVTAQPPGGPGGSSSPSAPASVTIPQDGSAQSVTLALRQPNVTGRVVDPNGSPVSGAMVNVRAGGQFAAPIANTNTGADGTFKVSLVDGTYTVNVQPPPSSQYGAPADTSISVAGSLRIPDIVLPQANVNGLVVQPNGTTPVANANVNIHTIDYSKTAWAQTGSDGTFHVTLAAGDYVVDVNPPFGTTFGAGRQSVTVVEGQTISTSSLTIALTTPNLSGTVVSTDGTPVPGAMVNAYNDDHSFNTNTQSDSNGAFRLTVPSSVTGAITIEANPPNDSNLGQGRTRVTLPATGAVTVSLTTPNVTGHVYNGVVTTDLSTAAAGAQVNIHSADFSFFTFAQADDKGKFRASLPPGTYFATAMPNGPSKFAQSAQLEIDVNADRTVKQSSLDLVLSAPEVTGTLVDASGDPVSNAMVQIRTQDFSQQAQGQTHSDGTFAIGGLPAGSNYVVEAFPPFGHGDLLHLQVNNFTIPSDPSQYPVTASNATDSNGNAVLQFQAASDTIRVTIQKPDGTPITSGANVNAFQDGGQFQFANQATSGHYDLKVASGLWRVQVNPTSPAAGWVYTGRPVAIDVPTDSSCTGNVCTLTITVGAATGHVTGHVVDASGNPVGAQTAFVDVRTPNGIGNGGPVGSGGAFDVAVPAGKYQVLVHSQNPQLGSPAAVPVNVSDGQSVDVGTLAFVLRDAQIRGTVSYSGGTALSGVNVFAFQPNGGGFANATTQSDGTYTLRVSAGTWMINIAPGPTDTWLFSGQPTPVTVASGDASTGHDFTVQASVARVTGRVLDPSGSLSGTDGFVFAENATTQSGTPLASGTFSLPLTAGTYTVHVFLPPQSPYSSPDTQQVTVGSDGTVTPSTLSFTLGKAQNVIQGSVVDRSGSPVSVKNVEVVASNASNFVSAPVGADGHFKLSVGKGAWHLSANIVEGDLAFVGWADPSTHTLVPGSVTFATDSDPAVTLGLVVDPADQHVTGTVVDSNGNAIPFAWVYANTPIGATHPLHTGANADASGHFDLPVPGGTYNVGAQSALTGQAPPAEISVDAVNGGQSVSPLVLKFRPAPATITGHVTAPVSGLTITVQAWSDSGGSTGTIADASGNYSLTVTNDDTWHVTAGAVSGTQGYSSVGVAVQTGASGTFAAPDIALAAIDVAASQTVTFDASQPSVVHFGDLTLTIPSGAVATSGNVSITASPITAPAESSASHPIGIGYTLVAFDSSGTQIKTFQNSIRVTYPYDPTQVAALGLDPATLVPSYLDPATNSYRTADGVTVDTTTDTVSFTTNHFTDFALVTTSLPAPTVASVSPASATAGTARTITVTGTGFRSGATVRIGSTAASSVTVDSLTQLEATVPASVAAGTYDVTVANSDGRSGSRSGALVLTGGSSSGSSGAATTDLGVSMTSSVASAKVGDTVMYTITVSHLSYSATATGITLTDVLPDGVSLVSAVSDRGSGTCTGSTTLTCFLDQLAGSDTATVRIAVKALRAGDLVNRVSVSRNEADSNAANDSASLAVSVAAAPTSPPTTPPTTRKAPTVSVSGAAGGKTLVATHAGAASVVATSISTSAPARVTVSVLRTRTGGAVTLLKGSRLGGTVASRAQSALSLTTTSTAPLRLRVLIARSLHLRVAYLRLHVAAGGKARTVLVRIAP